MAPVKGSGRRSTRPRAWAALAVACILAVAGPWSQWGRAFAAAKEVLVTGASGRTGKLVVEKLAAGGTGFSVRALVRSEAARRQLLGMCPGLQPEKVFVGDIRDPSTLQASLAGCAGLVIVTSAVPRIKIFSLVKTLVAKLFGKKVLPKFGWKGDQKPESVDWEGQKNQVDAAIAAGVTRIVLVGSMGGTQPENFLNKIGEGEGDNILVWKRKAEMYLMDKCKDAVASYTIIHPGGLIDAPGGERQVILGVDDVLTKGKDRSIPRSDVAELCVQALQCQDAADRSFDAASQPPGTGEPLKPCKTGEGLAKLLESIEGRNCDYTLNPPP